MDKAFAKLQLEDIPHLDIQVIEGEIDPLALRIPLSVKDEANFLNVNLTEMVNLILCNFHNELTGKEETLIRLLKTKDTEFISRFVKEFTLSLKEIKNEN